MEITLKPKNQENPVPGEFRTGSVYVDDDRQAAYQLAGASRVDTRKTESC